MKIILNLALLATVACAADLRSESRNLRGSGNAKERSLQGEANASDYRPGRALDGIGASEDSTAAFGFRDLEATETPSIITFMGRMRDLEEEATDAPTRHWWQENPCDMRDLEETGALPDSVDDGASAVDDADETALFLPDGDDVTERPALRWDVVQIVNGTPYRAKGKVGYSACRSDSYNVVPQSTWTASSRGGCLLTSIHATVNDGKEDGGTAITCKPYKSSGTSYSQFAVFMTSKTTCEATRRTG